MRHLRRHSGENKKTAVCFFSLEHRKKILHVLCVWISFEDRRNTKAAARLVAWQVFSLLQFQLLDSSYKMELLAMVLTGFFITDSFIIATLRYP